MFTRRAFNVALLNTLAAAGVAPLAACAIKGTGGAAASIDTHAHVFLRDLPMPDKRRAPSGYDAPPEDYLGMLDANGMTHGVLVQPSFLGTDNSYLVAALRKYPERLRGIAVVDPAIPPKDLDAMNDAGVVGVRLNLVGLPLPPYATPPWRNFLREVNARQWQVEVHQVGPELKPVVEGLLENGCTVVVDHFGRPDPKLGVDDPGLRYLLSAAKSGRLYVKLSAAYRNGANGRGEQVALAAVPLLKEAFGVGRLVWGSDWPHTLFEKDVRYAAQRKLLDEWLPDAADRKAVLADTPFRLFRFGVR
jgi:predicted TIM-barrel fold metal-dependent hydrolase